MVAGRPSPYQLLLDKLHWLNHVIMKMDLTNVVYEWFILTCYRAREIPVTQTLTSCQMLPVTVTGSAFDRKIVSVLPVPFLARARTLRNQVLHAKPSLHM